MVHEVTVTTYKVTRYITVLISFTRKIGCNKVLIVSLERNLNILFNTIFNCTAIFFTVSKSPTTPLFLFYQRSNPLFCLCPTQSKETYLVIRVYDVLADCYRHTKGLYIHVYRFVVNYAMLSVSHTNHLKTYKLRRRDMVVVG